MKNRKSSGFSCIVESLEHRRLLSATTSISLKMSTTTTVLGDSITATATVTSQTRGLRGTVEILDNGIVVGSAGVNKHGIVSGTIGTLTNGTGGNVFSVGTNDFTAKYLGSATFNSSRTRGTDVNILMPSLTTVRHSGGVQIATIIAGSGAATVSGDSADIAYSGYLTNGTLFDSTTKEANEGNGTGDLTFTIDANPLTVIAGMNSGVKGMLPDEVRVISIPADAAYGNNPPGGSGIPDGATLIFVVGLISN